MSGRLEMCVPCENKERGADDERLFTRHLHTPTRSICSRHLFTPPEMLPAPLSLSLSLSRMLRRMNKHTEGNRAGPRFLYTHMEQDVDRSVKKITNRVLPTK
jgi:hypothetical protein